MENVEIIKAGGFVLHLDMSLYSRPAVLKVLNRWTNLYVISLSRAPKDILDVEMESLSAENVNAKSDSEKILNALMFEMLRMDVIAQTSNIRELLVGRALYATCIEVDKASGDTQPISILQNWQEDSRRILASWSNER